MNVDMIDLTARTCTGGIMFGLSAKMKLDGRSINHDLMKTREKPH